MVCCCLMALGSMAQQQLGQRPRVKSPVVNADGTVTFNFYDPTAQRVSVNGDFREIGSQRLEMTKQDNGVWTVTTAPLNPELYSYSLSVDGQRFVDPSNSYVNRDISTLSNIFIVSKSSDDKGHLYQVNNVPHGTLSRVWYDSPTLGQQRRMTVYLPAALQVGLPFGITTIIGTHFPSAMRLSIICDARPKSPHAVSSPPWPCNKYITGKRFLPSYAAGR